jgi:hypothetical protein
MFKISKRAFQFFFIFLTHFFPICFSLCIFENLNYSENLFNCQFLNFSSPYRWSLVPFKIFLILSVCLLLKTNNIEISKIKSNLVFFIDFPKIGKYLCFEVSKTQRQKKKLMNRIGGIKYRKSTIRNQSIRGYQI